MQHKFQSPYCLIILYYLQGTDGYLDSAIILTDYVPPEEGSDIRQPIPLAALGPHVERMHLNENCGFGEEYRVRVFF